jgi:thioredoxin 1
MKINKDGKVLLDFWSPNCGPCVFLSPVIDQIKEECEEVQVIKVNVHDNLELAQKFDVMSLPTLVFINDGKVVEKTVGPKTKSQILEIIQNI